jgi:hypothetical protein
MFARTPARGARRRQNPQARTLKPVQQIGVEPERLARVASSGLSADPGLRSMIPEWLNILSVFSIALGVLCAVLIAMDEVRHPQHMRIMAVVWPVTALFGSLIALVAYFSYGRQDTREAMRAPAGHREHSSKSRTPFPVIVAKGTCHCGAGCCIGDILAEWLAAGFPTIAVWLGWQILFHEKTFAIWILDYLFAFVLGIAFQYFAIKPMRDDLSGARALRLALKADVLSLTAWQVGMYGFMAFAQFYLFQHLFGARTEVSSPTFWFTMQLAMIFGFLTSYPVNWWLIRAGVKEAM